MSYFTFICCCFLHVITPYPKGVSRSPWSSLFFGEQPFLLVGLTPFLRDVLLLAGFFYFLRGIAVCVRSSYPFTRDVFLFAGYFIV